jgi:rubrerythrin
VSALRRRELLVRAGAAGAAGAIAGAWRVPGALAASSNPDVATVESFVKLELTAAVVYDTLAGLRLDAATRSMLSLLAEQERAHAAVLLNAAEYLGGPPRKAPSPEAVKRAAPALARARTRHDALAIAIEVERIQLRGYYAAQQQLSDTKLLQQTATIMGGEGQHMVAVRLAMGAEPIPSAFEVGAT